ncbi:hypothetical protein [Brevundimonas diminuta]|uniref:hypothetical protein n=1 Tax=Brevundimonas diminuta TaxID=293 RepID=UPI003CFCCBE9
MRIFLTGATAAVLLGAATAAMAQDGCVSLDRGTLSIGQVLTAAQQQALRSGAPVGALHCGRTGCTAQAPDGVSYSWRRDGRIVGKRIELTDASGLPGWRGSIDQAFADGLGRAACTRFTLSEEELEGGYSMQGGLLSTWGGQAMVVNIFGEGTVEQPLTIELRAADQ